MLAAMLSRTAGLVVALAALWAVPGARRSPPVPAPPAAVARASFVPGDAGETVGPAGILIRGGADGGLPVTVHALERVLATATGERARELLASGALPGPLVIEVNHRGDNFTRYRVAGHDLGETITFDPGAFPLVETEGGTLPALPETVLAHELGHALFKLDAEDDVIREVENPVRAELGLPRRTRF